MPAVQSPHGAAAAAKRQKLPGEPGKSCPEGAFRANLAGRAPGPESSILKIRGSEVLQEAYEFAIEAMGHNALGWFDDPPEALPASQQWIASTFNYYRAATIYGGSNEIQRNIISKMILGLPDGAKG